MDDSGRAAVRHSVLSSKLTPPPLPSGTIRRDGPIKRLSGQERIALLVAPPGYGKTVVARQWLDHAVAPTAWLSVDLIDASPQSFWLHVLASLRTVLHGLDAEPELLLEERGPDHVFLAELGGQIEQADRAVNLVLDDLTRVDGPVIVDGLAFLVERVGHLLRVIATSRSEPSLPLAAWRARSWVAELGEDDLRFDDAEAMALAAARVDAPIAAAAVSALNQRLEGWPIAMYLAVHSLETARGDEVDRETDSEQVLADYIVQVIDRLPAAERQTALALSVLRWFDAELCRQLLDDDAVPILHELQRQRLFLQVLDEKRGAMRFHALVRTILQRELRWRDARYHDQLHRLAARLWLARGDVPAAHRHLVAIGDTRGAFALIIQPALDLANRGDRAGLVRLMTSLPRVSDVDDASLALDLAVVSFLARRGREVAEWCDQAERNADDDPTIQRRLNAMRGLLALMTADLETAWVHIEGFDRVPPDAEALRDPVVNEFAAVKARHALATGQHERARVAIEELATLTEPESVVKVSVPTLEAWLHLELGHLRQASVLAEQASGWVANSGAPPRPSTVDAFVVDGWCRVGAGDLTMAAELGETARSQAEALGFAWDLVLAGDLVAEVLRLRGELQASLEVVRDLHAEIGSPPSAFVAQVLNRIEAAALVSSGRFDEAREVIDRLPDRTWRVLLLARLAVESADDHAVTTLLAERQAWPVHHRLEAGVLLAAVGRPAHRDDLALVLTLGAETGWLSPFLGHGGRVALMLRRAPVERFHPALANAMVPNRDRSRPFRPGARDPLSQRELSVLAFLPTHLSYAQIGTRMYLSVNTIKTTLKSIYRKLDVGSRADAVEAARAAGLL